MEVKRDGGEQMEVKHDGIEHMEVNRDGGKHMEEVERDEEDHVLLVQRYASLFVNRDL